MVSLVLELQGQSQHNVSRFERGNRRLNSYARSEWI